MTASESPEMWKALANGATTRVECGIVDDDLVQTEDSAVLLAESSREHSRDAEILAIEEAFVQPLNKFITGGPLHALASLTRVDLSRVERLETPAGDFQQTLQQSPPLLERSGALPVENVMSFNSGPFLPTKPSRREAVLAASIQDSSTPRLEGQCVLMRANMAYEPVGTGAPPVATSVSLRKKIKMKAPTPKQSLRGSATKKSPQSASDVKPANRLQAGEQDKVQNGTSEQCSGNHCIVTEVTDSESQQIKRKLAKSQSREDEKTVFKDARKQNTCVVTHSEHSIEVSELQDPPSRRRWPKMSPSFTSISNRNDMERSSTSSTCVSLQDEEIPNGEGLDLINTLKSSETPVVRNEDVEVRETSASSLDNIGRSPPSGEVEERRISELPSDRSDRSSGQHDMRLKDAVIFKTGLRISVPSASVREISVDPASRRHEQTLSDSNPCQGEEGELEKLSNELHTQWELTSPLPVNILSCRAQSSGLRREEEASQSRSSQESNPFPPDTRPGQGNGSPGKIDQGDLEKLSNELQTQWELTSPLPVNFVSCRAQSSGLRREEEASQNPSSQESNPFPPDATTGRGSGSPRKIDQGDLEKLSNELHTEWELTSPLPVNFVSCRAQSSGQRREDETSENPSSQESNPFPPDTAPPGRGNGSPGKVGHPSSIPERTRDDALNENSTCSTIVIDKNSDIKELNTPSLAPATGSREQLSKRATPESMKFGSGLWSSNPLRGETYPERTSLSSEKLSNILSYLGHVEESTLQENYTILHKTKPSCYSPTGTRSPRTVLEHDDNVSLADSTFTTTLTTMSNRSATDSNANSGDGDGSRNPAVSLFEGVRKKIQHYKDSITGQLTKNAELLKELESVRADKEQALSLEREKFGRELEIRASEYKAAIQHHLSLNEKMVRDKEKLSEKCCNLAGNLRTAESKFEDKLKTLQEQAAQELKKQKELWNAGEKPRREAWKDMKLKEIKEITIKGLEPHIEGIVEKNKQEMQKLETRCADDAQKKLELQAIQQRQEMCELRDRLLKDRDDLLEKERMAALTRMNEVAEKYEQQAMQLRLRVSGDMAAELEKVEESRRKDKHDAHELLSKFQQEAAEREDTLRKGLERAMHDAISVREDEISQLRAQLVKEKNEWQTALDEKLQQEMQIKEKELQTRCTKERDEQIEMIIERMETDKDEAIAEHQQDLLIKVERLMEEKLDFMKRMKEVETKCASLCQLSLEAKQKAELELDNRDVQLESLERELSCQADLMKQLKAQINQEKSNLKQQEERFQDRLKKEQKLLQSALQDVERCNEETQQMRARKVEELAELEAHVRQAIDNKDLVIAGLREQLLSAREQIRHTEMLLS